MMDNITGIILAGGKSSRMGEDKAFIPFSGRPLVENLIGILRPLFKDLMIVTNAPGRYERYGIETHEDIIRDKGPLGGIYTGLMFSKSLYNFFAACDTPFLNRRLIEHISRASDGYDAVVAEYDGRPQPLCALYSKNCTRPIKAELDKNNLRVRDFFKGVKVKLVSETEVLKLDADGSSFLNINTPTEYRSLASIRKK